MGSQMMGNVMGLLVPLVMLGWMVAGCLANPAGTDFRGNAASTSSTSKFGCGAAGALAAQEKVNPCPSLFTNPRSLEQAQLHNMRACPRGIGEMMADKAVGVRRVHIFAPVIEEQSFARRERESLQRERVNGGIGLGELLFARNDDALEPVEQLCFAVAKGRPEFMAEIGDAEHRHTRRIEIGHKLAHPLDRAGDGFVEARLPCEDEIAMIGKTRDQLCTCFGKVAPGIVLEMPVGRHDIFQKRIKRPTLRDQALVESPWAPAVKDVADVENDGGHRHGQLALARLETLLRLVDDVGAAATTDHAVIPVTVLERLERVADLHDRLPVLTNGGK